MTRTSQASMLSASTWEVPMPVASRLARRLLTVSQSALLLVLPHGGQRAARTNALRAVRKDALAATVRREVAASLAAVEQRAYAAISG
jgi:hypothetical protein